jgi:DNA polymerase III subunit alpha
MNKPFSHLHVHSHYSLLTALPKIKDLIAAAQADNMTALALTDNGNLYGAIDFYKKCKEAEIKPILGIDAYMATRTRKDKERMDARRTRLLLLVKNNTGYKNLIELITDSHLEGFYYKPRIDRETITKFHEGLICISPSFNSEIVNALAMSNKERALEILSFYKDLFGEDFYLEITYHPEIEGHEGRMNLIKEFAKETSTKLVAAGDVYYIKAEDRDARRTLMSVQNTFGGDAGVDDEENFSFISQKQANQFFKNEPEALDNIQEIIDKCNLELELGNWVFPAIDLEGRLAKDVLREKAFAGIERRKMEKTESLLTRIEYELDVIETKGYSPYFLVVGDLIRYAKEAGIQSNTRGSAAGSLVSYLVGITTVDPIEYGLPFERFLNPERPSPPDIDMDFADNRRDDVIEYARRKYGAHNVAQIGTFGKMLAKGAVRDTARAMGFAYEKGDAIAKLIPMGAQGFPMTIKRALDETPELKELYKTDADSKTIIDMARKIEGCARHIGVHAAGVVISPTTMTDFVPVQMDPKGEGKIITQYDMHSVEEAGLLKFDFLGLKNLSIIAQTVKMADKLYEEKIDVDFIPLDDKNTFEMLARGETEATFQLNGDGMTRFLKELKPSNIHDINAMVALYRPGPLAFIPDYIERKHNPEKVVYFDAKLKPYLETTYGILIYQDDILLIAVNLAGYSWGEADKFRKAVGKKIPEEMKKQKEKFINGCIEIGGFSEENTNKLWDMIETFAAYGFNKAHAAAYGRVAYLTSYLKANYPVLYMASVLTADSGDVDKIAVMVHECERMGITVLPPDINESFAQFGVVPGERGKEIIRFGLTTIKNFGQGIADAIIEERKKNGKFKDLEDFFTRVIDRNLNKKSLEALIKTGAFDSLYPDRSTLLHNLENLLRFNKDRAKADADQDSLFAFTDTKISHLHIEPGPKISKQEMLGWEKELLGLYVTGNPLDQFKDLMSESGYSIAKLKAEIKDGKKTVVAGLIEEVKPILTKKGDPMAFLKIKDYTDSIECVCFPKIYEQYREIIDSEGCIAVKGAVSERNGEKSILVDKMKKLEE